MLQVSNPGLHLLILAGESIKGAVAGCSTLCAVPTPEHQGRGAGSGGNAIDHFGPLIVARWSEWLKARPREEQEQAIEQLACLKGSTARQAVGKVVDGFPSTLAPEDKRVAADYLAAIPATVHSIVVPDPDNGRMIAAPSTIAEEQVLYRFLPTNVPPFVVGSELPGTPYRLEQLLGMGGFGAVYKATNRFEQNAPPRAIKFCLHGGMLASLIRERELLDRLMAAGSQTQWSDRVVKLFGHSLDSPVPFLVYEYVPGGNLIHRLAALRKQGGVNLRPAQVLGLVRRICEAVAFAHQRGLVHRDIKPSNILVSGNTIKLADFGLGGVIANFAARTQSASGSGLSVSEKCSHFRGAGTPLYMSPEQRRGDPADPRHDVYSIGVMWYQFLVGDYTRELHQGWADELAEEFDISSKHIELIQCCVGYLKKRPATAGELLATLPSPTTPHVPPIRTEQVGPGRILEGHDSQVNSLVFTRNTRHLLSGSSDGTVRLWDLDSGRELACYRLGVNVSSVAVSPDGRRALFGCGDFTARLWDLTRGHELGYFAGHMRAVTCVAFSPDGRRAVTGGADASIRLWHVASAREILRFDEHRKEVSALSFTPDGLFVLSCSQDGALCLWDSETGWETQQLPGTGDWPLCVAVSPDGRRAACGGVERLTLWDLENVRSLATFNGHTLAVMSVQFTPNCQQLLSGSLDKTVRLWDVASRRQLHLYEGHTLGVNAVAVSPDARHAASAGLERSIRVWTLPRPDY